MLRAPATEDREVYAGSENGYREAVKTSVVQKTPKATALRTLIDSLPDDATMAQRHPELRRGGRTANVSPRISLENRVVRVKGWIYHRAKESDHDYHMIVGDTPELMTNTRFMNAEISALPRNNPALPPFAQVREDFRSIVERQPKNDHHLYDPPIPVEIVGSLFWDGEHPSPHNVGPRPGTTGADIRPKKAWEIHPVMQIAPGR